MKKNSVGYNWLDNYPSGVYQLTPKGIEKVRKNYSNVTKYNLAMNNIGEIYKKGHTKNIGKIRTLENFSVHRKYSILWLLLIVFIFYVLIQNKNVII